MVIYGGMKLKQLLFIALLIFSSHSMAEWVEYVTKENGDVFYFDDARVKKDAERIIVWNRVRYKTSVMAASSYQSLIKIDCSEYSKTILQSTFYTDKDWTSPAMATNTKEKPKEYIEANSAAEQLANILCNK